jgi:pimeloyl-ACP methyl ester carboxylesterase
MELKGKSGLVVFLHGFPDSYHLWHQFFKSNELKNIATMVAVDLPGFGGSDDLDVYDADHVLEAISEFIIRMRERYASVGEAGQAPVVVVGHDWGALVGFRLASDAPVIADRFILSNSFYVSNLTVPPLSISSNVMSAGASSSKR